MNEELANDELYELFKTLPFMNDVRVLGYLATKPYMRKVDNHNVMVVKLGMPTPINKEKESNTYKIMFVEVVVWDNVAVELLNIYHLYDLILVRGYLKVRPYTNENKERHVEYYINGYGISKMGKLTAKQKKLAESSPVRSQKYISNFEVWTMERQEDGTDVIYANDDSEWLLM